GLATVAFRPGVNLTSFGQVKVGTASFDLDPKYYRRRYDPRSRDWVDARVSDADKTHLIEALGDELTAAMPDSKSGDVLFIEPIITMVQWSRVPTNSLNARPNMTMRSVGVGAAAVRFNLRRGGPDGELVGTVLDYWRGTAGDGFPRTTVWWDAERAFHITSERLADRLRR
ncbi:MAG: hypothetical protein AAFX94_24355, partial [Myxococcota bacterium]